jgi:hypothetical protein
MVIFARFPSLHSHAKPCSCAPERASGQVHVCPPMHASHPHFCCINTHRTTKDGTTAGLGLGWKQAFVPPWHTHPQPCRPPCFLNAQPGLLTPSWHVGTMVYLHPSISSCLCLTIIHNHTRRGFIATCPTGITSARLLPIRLPGPSTVMRSCRILSSF